MSVNGQFWQDVRNQAQKMSNDPVMVGEVVVLTPFALQFQGVEIGVSYGDTIYMNNLVLDENIELDVPSMDNPQAINPALWQANNSPTASVEISGTQKQFLTDLYNWVKAFHNRFILHVGDNVAVQKLGNNTYIILDKIQRLVNVE